MKSKYQEYDNKVLNIPGIITGILIGYIITLAFFIMYAIALTFTSLSELTLPTLTMLITIIGIVVAGALSARNTKSKGWLNGGLAGLLYAIIMLLLGVFFVKDVGPTSAWALKLLWGVILGAIGGMIGINL
ncbi:TIGR04086 family membrane protein [Thermoanaerobacterium sp. RBIITD]|uniref:TIGR04086 family membrane protein n=1 Tax=Thermoanaerobacterium sp. RBIITD TaxID=1550240 RepID=UPI000BB8E282|nr:TIGR04086 family membrane protein [Thermoanaerobacterium sp. RBIITD]SNX52655.1 putative membrane protein, TIGR04086 family [Thermoanaerobacterium sp. RBIITD]